MSTVFEAFVVREEKEKVKLYLEKEEFEIRLLVTEIQEGVTGLVVDSGDGIFNQKRNEKIAIKLAQNFDNCLVTYWDDRIGLCSSELYDQKGLLKQFGKEDEIWLEYQGNYLNSKGLKYSGKDADELSKLDRNKSYDCVFSAIDAGLFALERFINVTLVGFIEKICSVDGE